MRIGITYDLKEERSTRPDGPDDLQEEFDSPVTIDAIAGVLRGLGHEVVNLGDGRPLLEKLLADPPDFVFNIAEGQGVGRSREARVPAVLEMLCISYTGSDPLALAVTLDKDCAKRLAASAGVYVPAGVVVRPDGSSTFDIQHSTLNITYPAIVKPAWEGSSKGIRQACIVDNPAALASTVRQMMADYGQAVLIEEYIQGDELTVGVIGNDPPQVIGIMRVLPTQPTDRFIYSIEVKRDFRRMVRYECPPKLPPEVLERIEKAALDSYRVLGCRDVARVDFRLRDGVPYFLEVNPLPGLNPDSGDIVILAKSRGWTYERLVETILTHAVKRKDRKLQTSGTG